MSWHNYDVVLLLGAGASKPLGIPTSDEMVTEFLDTEPAEPISPFKDQIIKEEWDIERLLRLIQHVKILGKEPRLQPLLGEIHTKQLEERLSNLNQGYEEVYDELLSFIRKRCLKPDLEQAKEIYKPLLELREKATIKIFTTNYDTAIENVCRDFQIEYNDGFAMRAFDDYKRFYPNLLGNGNVQLYKLHGSVNWWSDITRQVVFRLSLDLEGLAEVKTMMIYPAEVESAFNYPFNILQSHFISSLVDAKEVIAIGHKFGDVNISSPIKALLERQNLKLALISPDAEKTKETIFNNHANIEAFPEKIESWMPKGVESISKDIKEYVKERKKKIIEADKKRKEELERIRQEIEEKYRPRTFLEVPTTSDLTTLPIQISGLMLQHQCPKCGIMVGSQEIACPNCGAFLGTRTPTP